MSAYRIAIDRTARVIERRARYFRNQVVTVVLVGAASIAWALAAHSPSGLAGILFLVPVCGLFFFADAKLLNQWRSGLLASWETGDLEIAALRDALRANPSLPKETTEGMLATLPAASDLAAEQRLLTPTRHTIAATSRAVHGARTDRLLLDAVLSGVAAVSLVAALGTSAWTPLLGLAVLVLRLPLGAWTQRRRLDARDAEVEACRRQPGFSEEWTSLPAADTQISTGCIPVPEVIHGR